MQSSHSKVIGFFAYRSREEVVCVECDACLIAGSEEAMREYVREFAGPTYAQFTIRKTRFGEILAGIRIGAAYGFDEESYSRFLPLARAAGLRAADADFVKARAQGWRFFTYRSLWIDFEAHDLAMRMKHEGQNGSSPTEQSKLQMRGGIAVRESSADGPLVPEYRRRS